MASRREGKATNEQPKTAESIMKKVDNISDTIKEISDKLVTKYCDDLDDLMIDIKSILTNDTMTDSYLETAQAELIAQAETMTLAIYSRAYKKVKLRMDAGYEMLNSLKKVMNKRITEMELSNSRYINHSESEV